MYVAFTARDDDLPTPLPATIGQVARLLDIDAAVHDKTVSLHSMRQIHSLVRHVGALVGSRDVLFSGFSVRRVARWSSGVETRSRDVH